jgi:hypothetical protein
VKAPLFFNNFKEINMFINDAIDVILKKHGINPGNIEVNDNTITFIDTKTKQEFILFLTLVPEEIYEETEEVQTTYNNDDLPF